jgi:phosphoribosylaminoimidazole-succinocarboxamide synthase
LDSSNYPDIYKPAVVIIKGSRSDKPHADDLGKGLQASMLNVLHDTASAHREPEYLVGRILEYNKNKDVIGYVTMAGGSDGLTGTVAAHTTLPVVAYHPDVKKYGEMKKFSSTALPSGSKAFFAYTPEEVLILLKEKSSEPVYTPDELRKRQEKRVEMYYTSNQDRGVEMPLGLPLLHKGKTRDVYELGKDQLLINASDRISAFDVNSVTKIPGKGEALTLFSNWWFDQTKHIIPNHMIDMPDPSILRVQKADRVNIEWVMRGYLYGSMARDYAKGERKLYGYELPNGLRLADKLPQVMLTPTTKADIGHDMPIDYTEATDRGLVTPAEWNELEEACFKLFKYYSDVGGEKGFVIPDFKLEFGRNKGELIQIDESPNHDSARIWVTKHYEPGKRQEAWCADKEFYRQFLLDSKIDSKNPPVPLPEIPVPVVTEIQKRLEVYKVFTGEMKIDDLKLRSLEDVEEELGITKKAK